MNSTDVRSFGELLREYRAAAGLTQEALAERAQMSRAAINKLERGARQRPYRATIELLADALSLSSSDRLNFERAAQIGTAGASRAGLQIKPSIRLPIQLSTFVGRDRDVAKVCHLLSGGARLVTLVGTGGVGKTRLAVHVAEHLTEANAISNHRDGVWFVDLSVVGNAEMTVSAIGSSVGMEQCRTFDMLIRYLRAQRFLLIIDNCEHLLDEVAKVAAELLRECPNGQILATSRQRLGVDGERVYRVPTLDVPTGDARDELSPSEALMFSAIRLFTDRAEAADSDFELTASMIPAVAEICRRLDGVALAIELAAARTNAFPPATLAERLDEHFVLLTGGTHGSLSRHKTMRAVFDWSYALLDEIEKRAFRRLSIFVGGFTLELATSLWTGETEEHVLVDVLASLVDKSLVQYDANVEPARYKMLEPVRQYAQVKLREHGEQNAAARAHAKALLALAERFDSRLELISTRVWDAYVQPERDNFRAAFDWALGANGDCELGQRLAGSRIAPRSGFTSGEVRKWTSAALKTCNESTPPEVQAKLALTAAKSAINFETSLEVTLAVCRRALELQQPGDLRAVADAQHCVGVAVNRMGRPSEADTVLREALRTARACGAQREYFFANWTLTYVRLIAGDLDGAREFITEALRESQAAGADRERINAISTLAEIEFASGSVEKAICLNKEVTEFFRTHPNPVRLARVSCNLSAYLIALQRYEEARQYAHEALQYSHALQLSDVKWPAIQHLAAIALFSNDRSEGHTSFRRAAYLLGFVNETLRRTDRWRMYTEQQEYDDMLAVLRDLFDEDQLATLMEEGREWSEDQAVAEALAM